MATLWNFIFTNTKASNSSILITFSTSKLWGKKDEKPEIAKYHYSLEDIHSNLPKKISSMDL